MFIPSFTHRAPTEIVTETNFFESSGRAYKALSWLDYAKLNRNISALEYAALEKRLAIEHLLFEQLVVGVGTELEAREYKKCCGNANKLNEIIERLIPKYERFVAFTKAMAPAGVPITKWDNRALIRHSGKCRWSCAHLPLWRITPQRDRLSTDGTAMDKDRTDCLSPTGLVRRVCAGTLRLTAPVGLNHSSARPGRGDQPRPPCWSAIRLARLSTGRSDQFCLSLLRSHLSYCFPSASVSPPLSRRLLPTDATPPGCTPRPWPVPPTVGGHACWRSPAASCDSPPGH